MEEPAAGVGERLRRVLGWGVVVGVAVLAVGASRALLTDEPTGQLVVTEASPTPSVGPPQLPSPPVLPPWEVLPDAPISGREAHTAVWTGSEMLVWGGRGTPNPRIAADDPGLAVARGGSLDTPLADGAAYDPAARTWRVLPPGVGRADHTAVWTGEEMIVWGGEGVPAKEAGRMGGGEALDPATGTWRSLASAPLSRRSLHTAVWTGTEMIVWGGTLDDATTDGAAYDPRTDTWRLLAPAPLPARTAHTAVWTGQEMVVWGGLGRSGAAAADGAAYDPDADTWRAVPEAPLAGRTQHAMVWDARHVLIWGGASGRGRAQADGAAWDPRTGGWELLPPAPLEARFAPAAVWTGGEMVVWGGVDTRLFPDGARYDSRAHRWRPVPPGPVTAPSRYPAVWSGRAMLVWAGRPEPSGAALVVPDG